MQAALQAGSFPQALQKFRRAKSEVERNPVRPPAMCMNGTASPPTSRNRRSSTNFSMHARRHRGNQLRRAGARHFWRQRDDRPHFARRRDQEIVARRKISHRERRDGSADFNSYGSRRGNDRVMTRGTFANVRIKNLMLAGQEGGVTNFRAGRPEDLPFMTPRSNIRRKSVPLIVIAGQEYGTGSVARLGREGHEPARRESRRRAELRAHPPQQSRRHGRAAVAIQGRHDRA